MLITANNLKSKLPLMVKSTRAVILLIVLIFSGSTYLRNIVWQDRISLWRDTVAKSPNKARPHYELGLVLGVWKNNEHTFYDEAIEHLYIALRLKPDSAETYNSLGLIYANKNQFDIAIDMYNKAISINPHYHVAYINRGSAYDNADRADKAIEDYNKAISINPDYAGAYYERGLTYDSLGIFDRAILDYRRACGLGYDKACEALAH